MKKIIQLFSILSLVFFYSFSTKAAETHPISKSEPVAIKVALLLDTSNSMDGLIDQAKAQLWDIVNELSYAKYGGHNPQLSIALYEYGNDGLEASDGYIRQVLDFGKDLDLISEKLFSLRTNGGSEYCGQVIQDALKDLQWGTNKQDLNLIFIAGNEAFTQGTVSYKNVTADANEKNITINTIFCGDYRSGISGKWQDAALRTGGDYFAINHNEEQIYIVTPYDNLIIQLNQELNDTYIYYGSQGYQKRSMQATQDNNAAALDEVVVVKRAVSKSTKMYNNASWDLVDAANNDSFNFKKINKKSLPKLLQHKSTSELKQYVAQQAAKRSKIQEKIRQLNLKRKQFIAAKKTGNTQDNLENAIIKTIKKQAKRKHYSW